MKKKTNYSLQEKKSAIYKVIRDGESVISVSQNMGIHRDTLYRWIKRYKVGGGSELIDRRIASDINDQPDKSEIQDIRVEIEHMKQDLNRLLESQTEEESQSK